MDMPMNADSFLRMAVCAVCLVCLCAGAETATVSVTATSGTTTVKTYPLQAVGDRVLRLTVPAASIPSDAKTLDIRADFATAKKGDEGYWVFPRGVYGTFRLDKGSTECWPMIQAFGLKTPSKTFAYRGRDVKPVAYEVFKR